MRRHYVLVSIGAFFVALNVFFYFYSPADLVAVVGINNTYLVTFAIAATGGLSTLTGTVLYVAIATFAAGGATPWLLGLFGGAGIFVSDSVFYLLARLGRESVPRKWEPWIDKVHTFVQSHPEWLVLFFMYLYLSFAPLPNDILMIALVLGGYRYRQIAPVLFVGSMTIAMIAAYFGTLWV